MGRQTTASAIWGVATVLISSHLMEYVDRLCRRVLILKKGVVVREGSPAALVQKHGVADLEAVFLKLTGRELRD